MCRHLLAGLLILLSAPLLLVADGDKEKSIEQLIEQLSDRKFQVREQAAKAIEALGPEALPALRKAKDHRDIDVRRRIEKWIPEFEAAALVAPKRVTLKLINQPLRKALEEVARQTGYKLEFDAKAPWAQKICSMQVDNETFWEAIDKVCHEGKLRLKYQFNFNPEKNSFLVDCADALTPFVIHHRAFRVTADVFDYERARTTWQRIEFGKLPSKPGAQDALRKPQVDASEYFHLEIGLSAEPRLMILDMSEPVVTEAVDDQGRSLLPQPGKGSAYVRDRNWSRSWMRRHGYDKAAYSFEIDLLTPAKDAKSLKVIRGTIAVRVEKGKKALVVTEEIQQAQGKTIELQDLSIQVDLLFKNPHEKDQYELFLTTKRAKPGADNSAQEDEEDGEFELQDAKGNSYRPSGGTGSMNPTRTEWERKYVDPGQPNGAPLGPPARLLYIKRTPLVYHVPFEFRDLPLR